MVSLEQLTTVIQEGNQRFLFGHQQKNEIIEYLHPGEVPTTFCQVKEVSIPALTATRAKMYVLLTSQRFIVISLDPHVGAKGWAGLDFESIDLSEIIACSPPSKASVTLSFAEGKSGWMMGWKRSMQRMHDALATAIGQDATTPIPQGLDVTREMSGGHSDSQSVPSARQSAGHSMSGRFRIALHFCFMTVPGLIAVTLTVVAAVFLPGPVKMVPVLILAGVIAQRISGGASG